LVGKAKETPYQKHFNTDFGVDEYFFENKATLTQKVKITNPKTNKIVVNVDFQACQTACVNDNVNLTFDIPVVANAEVIPTKVDTTAAEIPAIEVAKPEVKETKTATVSTPKKEEKKGLWTIFFLAFIGGFAALLTPCVFPMIPMTVSFLRNKVKHQHKENAMLLFMEFQL